jgi:hypothetical protein
MSFKKWLPLKSIYVSSKMAGNEERERVSSHKPHNPQDPRDVKKAQPAGPTNNEYRMNNTEPQNKLHPTSINLRDREGGRLPARDPDNA